MSFLATIAAIALWLVLGCMVAIPLCLILHAGKRRFEQTERDLAERSASLDGFIANAVVNSIHDGSAY